MYKDKWEKKLLKRIILSTFFGVLGSQNWNYHVHLNIRIFEHLHIWIFEISLFGVLNSQNWNCVNSELDLKSWVSLWFYDHHRKGDRFNVCSIRKDGSDFSILTPPSPPKKIPTNATNKQMQQTHQHYHVTRYQEDIIYLLKSRIWKQTFHLWIVIYTWTFGYLNIWISELSWKRGETQCLLISKRSIRFLTSQLSSEKWEEKHENTNNIINIIKGYAQYLLTKRQTIS